MTTGDPCTICDGRMSTYHTRRRGSWKVRFLRCSNLACPSRGKQVLPAAEPVRSRSTSLVLSSLAEERSSGIVQV